MDEVFKSHRDITDYLDGLGYKVSKSKLGRDLKRLEIEKGEGGIYPKKDILEYAATLDRKGDDGVAPAELQAKKTACEVESLEFKIKKQKFEYERERGKYIPRKDFESELAARAVVLESGFRYFFSAQVQEIIAIVGGKVEKTPDLLQFLNDGLDQQLNKYATLDVFQVLFEDDV